MLTKVTLEQFLLPYFTDHTGRVIAPRIPDIRLKVDWIIGIILLDSGRTPPKMWFG